MYQMVRVKDLVFDLKSPRLTIDVDDEAEMLEWLLDIGGVREFMLSIGHRGFFAGEPLLVVEAGPLVFVVVDGNQRLAALRLLLRPDLCDRKSVFNIAGQAKYKPEAVPCILFSERETIIKEMGFKHISGGVKWGALEEARYFDDFAPDDRSVSGQAMSVGVRKRYVVRLTSALKLYEKVVSADFYGIDDLSEGKFSFALFVQALNYHNIAQFVKRDGGLEKLVRWLFEWKNGMRRIPSSERLGELDRVVVVPLASRRFEEGISLRDAYIIAGIEED